MKPKKGETVQQQVVYKFPPKRTQREWAEIMRIKLQQLEAINYEIVGKKSWRGGND